MKELIQIILLEIVLFIICYLLGAFYAVTFNIYNWLPATRGIVIGGFSTIAILILMAYCSLKGDDL